MSSSGRQKVALHAEFPTVALITVSNHSVFLQCSVGAGFADDFSPWRMLSSDTWEMVAAAGLLLSVVAGIVEGPWAAVVFSLLYGSAVLSILRSW